MKLFVLFSFFTLFFTTCGIERFYFLPQVPVQNIRMEMNTDAILNIPTSGQFSLSSADYNELAPGYSIYYRIYISNHYTGSTIDTQTEMNTINASLNSDFTAFISLTDPTNNTAVANSNTFRNRNYHRLELEGTDINTVITRRGGQFSISFPSFAGDFPTLTYNENEYVLFRNSGDGQNNGFHFTLEPDRYFFYTDEIIEKTDHPNNFNNDVIMRSDRLSGHAYVSMYIVATGVNPTNFTTVFSKPTHIGIFKLTSN